jgi:hypothetical protein
MGTALSVFLSGTATAGLLIAGLFFFRFWRRTSDFLFAAFGAAFLLLAANQAILALANIPLEYRSWVYLLKVLAFGLLILAIVRKNLAKPPL